jgi:hypothetical protein
MYIYDSDYTRGSAHLPSGPNGIIPYGLVEHCGLIDHTFSVEHQLSVSPLFLPVNPFPAALLDALAGYTYIIRDDGFHPSNIFVAGDSAGRSLAIALTRHLFEIRAAGGPVVLPAPPGDRLLICPWADMGVSHRTSGSLSVSLARM